MSAAQQMGLLASLANLLPEAFAALSPDCMPHMTAPQAQSINANQARVMTMEQFSRFLPLRIPDLQPAVFAALRPNQCIAHLDPAMTAAITNQQAGAITEEQFAAFPALMIPHLRPGAFGQLNPDRCIAHLNQDKTAAITADQAASITDLQFAAFRALMIPHLHPGAFGRLDPVLCIAHLDQDKTAAITDNQAAAITREQFARLSGDVIQYLTNTASVRLSDVNCIRHLTQAQVVGLTNQQIARITPDMFEEIPFDRIPDLPYARFSLIDQICYPRFTAAQVGQLSVAQVNIMGVKYKELRKEMWPNLQPAPFERLLRYLGEGKPRAQAVKDYLVDPNNRWNGLAGVFEGNRTFGNYKNDSGKRPLPEVPHGQYKEFDITARNVEKRGKRRIVIYTVPTHDRYKAWYTKTHYNDFWPLD